MQPTLDRETVQKDWEGMLERHELERQAFLFAFGEYLADEPSQGDKPRQRELVTC